MKPTTMPHKLFVTIKHGKIIVIICNAAMPNQLIKAESVVLACNYWRLVTGGFNFPEIVWSDSDMYGAYC